MKREEILAALAVLVGLPVSRLFRSAGMAVFHFGDLHKTTTRMGRETEVGQYALHLRCPWRIVANAAVYVGSVDMTFPADDDAPWETFDADKGVSRFDRRAEAWLRQASTGLAVASVDADELGGFTIHFRSGAVLEAFPADSLVGLHSELWRLFRPDEKGHFVMLGHGGATPNDAMNLTKPAG